jgi:hypothetical protein
LVTTEDKKEWKVDIRGKDEFTIQNEIYLLYRGVIDLPVHPDSRTNFLRITGNFLSGARVKIYYYFETVYGRFLGSLKFGERIKKAESGKLPYSKTIIT